MSTDFCVETLLKSMMSGGSSSCLIQDVIDQQPPSNWSSPYLAPSQKVPPVVLKPDSAPVEKKGKGKRKAKAEKENTNPAKRTRTCFSKAQLDYLEKSFAETPYPDKLLKDEMAEKLSLAPQKVHVSENCAT